MAALCVTDLGAQSGVIKDSIPGTLVTFELVSVPGGMVTMPGRDGKRVEVKPFLIGRTELTWEAYDAFTLSGAPDVDRGEGLPDAKARPSRPYGAPDYGFGHAGFPTMSVARTGAEAFCVWLSEKTGKRYRLPTEAEWLRAAELAIGSGPLSTRDLDALAWHSKNSEEKTHAVGAKRADRIGLYDLFGNVAEWVVTDDSTRATRGGSYRDDPTRVGPGLRALQDDSWNERDPQIPKSRWWLSDAPFVGFRIVREP
jgi:formylglycine-generating enzyme required for sulfatase activity